MVRGGFEGGTLHHGSPLRAPKGLPSQQELKTKLFFPASKPQLLRLVSTVCTLHVAFPDFATIGPLGLHGHSARVKSFYQSNLLSP